MRRKQCIDRVVGDKAGSLEPARSQRIAEYTSLEDRDQRRLNLALLGALAMAVLNPDLGLFDEVAHIDDRQSRQHADPQHAAQAYVVVEQAVYRARQQEAETPRPLQKPAHKPAR